MLTPEQKLKRHEYYLRRKERGVVQKYLMSNREHILATKKSYDARNADARRAYRAAHREESLTYQREWTKANPAKVQQYQAKRRKRLLEGSFTLTEWLTLCAAHDFKCLSCNCQDKPLTVDHIVPVSKGGTNTIGNIQPLCKSCNSKKYTKEIDYRIKGELVDIEQ